MKYNFPKLSFLFILTTVVFSCQPKEIDAELFDASILTSWNELIIDLAIEEDGLMTLKGVRTEALMHTAIHNALNRIKPVYATYHFDKSSVKADPIVAVAQAAYAIGVSQFPEKNAWLQENLDAWLNQIPDGELKSEAIKLGKESAAHILALRKNDQWNGEAEYAWHPMAPGVYAEFNEHSGTPEGFIFGAGWAKAQPFLLSSTDQFRSPPPPTIDSDAYTQAFKEVKAFGEHESKLRTADQAHLAMWWKDFVENSHNRLARDLVEKETLNLWEAARLFSLLNMTIFDAYVNVFDNKFHYNHWRPYTAIRWAENDDNPLTEADPEWNNLHQHTYAFPSYPSAHGTASSAAMTVLANTLGKGDQYTFNMSTPEVDQAGPFSPKVKMDPPTRSFKAFSEAGLEASLSRVYLGIHFRYDSEEGHRLGNEIGQFAVQNYLLPASNN